jgi:hypothetical protein
MLDVISSIFKIVSFDIKVKKFIEGSVKVYLEQSKEDSEKIIKFLKSNDNKFKKN